MKKIKRLSPQVIAKIAAGEVIERPAYAVKELIENAIDARASVIEIQIEESGLKRITVIDNGEGMSKDDLEICFLPHTTSKIFSDEDLSGIQTLGFRGEALASIAAFSHMTIITRTPKDIGGRILQIKGGIVEDSAPIGSPIGTIVTAEGLFFSVPARKKFLKSAQTEFKHIIDIVTRAAYLYPDVHFTLKHNKKTILDLPKKNSGTERLQTLMGPSIIDELIPLRYEDGHIHISGYLGKPQIALRQNQKQFIFLNDRPISDKMLSLAVKESFGTLLPASHTPVFLLQVVLPREMVDVNVHPRKEQVSYTNAKLLFDAVKLGVQKTLSEHNLTFNLAKFKNENSGRLGHTDTMASEILKDQVLPWNRSDQILPKTTETLTQIQQTYILAADEQAIFFVDQHAAHERILYNNFETAFKDTKKMAYVLEKPETIDFSPGEIQIINEYQDLLITNGFHIEPFHGTSYTLRSVPSVCRGRNYKQLIVELLEELQTDGKIESIDKGSQRMLQFLACRNAVKSGDVLSQKAMKDILTGLMETKHNETCPHGRPTTLTYPLSELKKRFRR